MSSKREKKKNALKQAAAEALTAKPQLSLIKNPVGVSFRFVSVGGDFCLSQCTQDEVRHYKDCLRRITTLTWQEVMSSGRKGVGKTGLNFTPYDDSALAVVRPESLDKSLTISGVRAGGKHRLFGAYKEGIYYVIWFDRNHVIVPDE